MAEIALALWGSGMFSKSPKPPERADAEEEARRKMEEERRRKGRGASMLTGPQGVTAEPTLGRHSLLGGG